MVKVAGVWDIWNKPPIEILQWRFMTKHFDVDTLYMTPKTEFWEEIGNSFCSSDSKFIELSTLNDAIELNPELTPIIIDEYGDIELNEFEHPQNALYLFGKTGYSPKEKLSSNILSDRIPSWATISTSLALLHPHQACSIVLYDRMNKWQ